MNLWLTYSTLLVMLRVGNLEICKSRRQVYRDGILVSVSARTTDLLLLLLDAAGQLVSKEDIIKTVWPGAVMDDSNIYVHVSAIRKLLGPYRRLLVGVSGRGYQLNFEAQSGTASIQRAIRDDLGGAYAIPASGPVLFGRQEAIKDIHRLLSASRVVTLTGAGGIGKTRLAVQSAKLVQPDYADGVFFIELAHFDDASAVRQSIHEIVATIKGRGASSKTGHSQGAPSLLLVLDNCEHLAVPVSHLVADLVTGNHQCAVLSTSRVPLGTAGEAVYQVQPLQVSSECPMSLPAAVPSAIAMFVAHARTVDSQFGHDALTLELISQLCQRLDGLPLAIEIAASRAAVLGIDALLIGINERFNSLSGGFRTALPRHQTLTATFDWSYKLLEENEKTVFRRISVFHGPFSLDDVCALASDEQMSHKEVSEAIRGLAAKSLLVCDDKGQLEAGYRLHYTARAYALQKLDENGERRAMELCLATIGYRKLSARQSVLPQRPQFKEKPESLVSARTLDVDLRLGIPVTQSRIAET